MTLADLLAALPQSNLSDMPFPQALLGAFRRKSITFANGLTDETTVVYWFQSKTFTIDLRLPDGPATPPEDRQGWVGDTLWDDAAQQLSWTINRSYQPRNQWPEPATLSFIGNCVLEYAPSGAYVEDWRQQSTTGPLLGLRLLSLFNETTGHTHAMDGGLIVAGDHAVYAQSRLPAVDAALDEAGDLAKALADGITTEGQIESYEVSVATNGLAITHSTQPERLGQNLVNGDFKINTEGKVILSTSIKGARCQLHFAVDCHQSNVAFANKSLCSMESLQWAERENEHLLRHAKIVR